ncbi:MAG: hypothetical protein QXE05_03170 [Nitrososphaeria archaeon]
MKVGLLTVTVYEVCPAATIFPFTNQNAGMFVVIVYCDPFVT